MSNIIDGRALAEKIKDKIVSEIVMLKGRRPNLAIILVGEREDSKLYVALKEKEAKKVGIDIHLYKLSEDATDSEILKTINFLNNDDMIDAILVQLPLPGHLDTDGIILAIDKNKDVDGFCPGNLENLLRARATDNGRQSSLQEIVPRHDCGQIIMPPVFGAALEMLLSIKYELAGKSVCIVANSEIFGKSLAKILENKNAKTEIAKADDRNLEHKTANADVIITAVGRPRMIKKKMVKKGAVVIDIGICRIDGKTYGDVDFEELRDVAGYITPVPGGVGPLTIAMAFKNTLELYKRKHHN